MSDGATRYVNKVTFSGSNTSTAIELQGGDKILGIFWPSAIAGTQLTFQAATEIGGTYTNCATLDGTVVAVSSITPSAGGNRAIDPVDLAHVRFVRLVSTTTETMTVTLATMDMC